MKLNKAKTSLSYPSIIAQGVRATGSRNQEHKCTPCVCPVHRKRTVVLKAWPRNNANSFKQQTVRLIADRELNLESPSTNLSRLEKAVLQCTFSCCPPAFLGPILDGMAEAVCPQDVCMYVCMTSVQLPSAASNHSLPHPS